MTIEEMIAVLEAAKQGKQIQATNKRMKCGWWDLDPGTPDWNFSDCDYRVKPEPREFYVVKPPDAGFMSVFSDAEAAKHWSETRIVGNFDIIHVREVIEQEPQ